MTTGHDAIGFRIAYRSMVLSGSLKTIFRPDNKKYLELYPKGSTAEGRIIKRPGSALENRLPILTDDLIILKIKSCRKIKIGDLKKSDFKNSSPDIHNQKSLSCHLGLIYNNPAEVYSADKKVVKIELEYLKINKGEKQ